MAREKTKKETNIEELKKKIGELNSSLEECQKKKEEYLAGWQRARADFLNYKKEEIERVEELLKYAGVEFILKILSILDNLEVAEKKIPDNLKKDENVVGLLQIKNQILGFLKNQGVEEIKIKTGEKFDPNFQEATEVVEKDNSTDSVQDESEIILEQIQKGYTIHGKVLRPAKVKVTK